MSGDQRSEPAPRDATVGDGPHLSIERLMAQLVDQAGQILAAQHRIQRLLEANLTIVSELSLPAVLRQIVESARQTAGARYAALGVIGSDGLLEEFIHVGMDDTTVAAIGDLPKGRGLLGMLIEHPRPAGWSLRLCVCFIRRSYCARGQRRNTREKIPAIDRAAEPGGCSRWLIGHTSNLQ